MAVDTSAPPAGSAAASDGGTPDLRGRLRARVVLPMMLLLVAAVLRLWNLGYPERTYFDEIYYAKQAQQLLEHGVETDFVVHPPVGKWLLAGGMALFGNNSFGWRFAAAVAGCMTVLATYLIGLRLFRRRGVAALAAFLLCLDGLAFTISRIAMLDAFLGLFVTAGVWLLLIDRDTRWAGIDRFAAADPDRPLPPRPHHWRWLAGVAFGLALATKWSALLAIGAAGLFVIASELLWRRQLTGTPWRGSSRVLTSVGLTLVVVPVVIYLGSYASWFANFADTRPGRELCPEGVCAVAAPQMLAQWWGEQNEIRVFHQDLEAVHAYRSAPWTWLYLERPVSYYYESCDDKKLAKDECVTTQGNVEEILGLGNPAVWWLALASLPVLGWLAARRRDWRAATVLLFLLLQYLPWFVVPRPNFLFYMVPAVPFLCLGLAYALWRLGRRQLLRWMPAVAVTLVVAAFLFWYPIWVGIELAQPTWQLRMWFPSWI
ncbi:MAG: phospholipid carrier-dependent glycosyltransferase [Actinomycetota bacterium]|nr:phospholipid carrier-dependent glycosyltransferase [Actinomycetota bacterium]